MTDPGASPSIDRSGDGWSYHVDASRAPEYVLFTAIGTASSDIMLQSIDDIIAVMDALVGPGATFCPLVIDLRQLSPTGLNLPAASRTVGKIIRRMGPSALVFDADTNDLVFGFFQMMAGVRPDVHVTNSLEEALDKVRG